MLKALVAIGIVVLTAADASSQTVAYPPPARQIAAAESPLPVHLQKGAKVIGYDEAGKLVTLRPGTNEMVCVADDPAGKRFHVACYHKSLEPFMARGRELRAQKKSEAVIDSTRSREVRMRRWSMPTRPAALYQYFAERDSVDQGTGAVKGAQYLYVVYTPYATYKSTGISENPIPGGPWIMFAGTPFAHLMIAPQKTTTVELK